MMIAFVSSSAIASGKTVAAFLSSDIPRYREAHRFFLKTMAEYGYPASSISTYTSVPDNSSWAASARKIVSSSPDIVVAFGAPAVETMLQEGDDIPLVASDTVFPDGAPAANLCGISSRVPMITIIRTLQGMIKLRKVAVLFNSREAGSLRQNADIIKASRQLGITSVSFNAMNQSKLDAAVSEALQANADVIVITESGLVSRHLDRIARRARSAGRPVASPVPDAAKMGALISIEVSPEEQGKSAALMAVRLLDGVKPENLGVRAPRKVDLIINLKVAREIGRAHV